MIVLALFLAAVNQVFSLLNPYILGHYIIDPLANHVADYKGRPSVFFKLAAWGLFLIICAAMVSRIAKAFQDYVVNVVIQKFGANSKVFLSRSSASSGLPAWARN